MVLAGVARRRLPVGDIDVVDPNKLKERAIVEERMEKIEANPAIQRLKVREEEEGRSAGGSGSSGSGSEGASRSSS